MNGERDFLRWISAANDALLAIAALAMMQRKEEGEWDDLQSFITQRLSASEDVASEAGEGRETGMEMDGVA